MVLGDVMTGKTTLLNVLIQALEKDFKKQVTPIT